jgi:5-methylcytosine-specific restriction endonuclease McrA
MASAKERILILLKSKVLKVVSREELAETSKVHDWQRMIRTLRQEGWHIESVSTGYILHSKTKTGIEKKRSSINNKLRYAILQRDNSQCQRCGKTIQDNIKLEIDHKIPVDWGGTNDPDNLWTLCNICNGGKKHFYQDFDKKIMTEVLKEKSGYARLKRFFELNPNIIFEPIKLEIISGIRDWTRTIRNMRTKEGLNITWCSPNKEFPNGGYKLVKPT